jgi:putative transposase
LNKLPKSQQSKAKRALQEIWMAETKKDALTAFDAFAERDHHAGQDPAGREMQ